MKSFQESKFMERFIEKVGELSKLCARTKFVLVVIFISLPVFLFLHKSSKFRTFEPPAISTAKPFEGNAQNNLSRLSRGVSDDAMPLIVDEHNNSSKPSKICCNLSDQDKQNNSSKPSKIRSKHSSASDKNNSLIALNISSHFIRDPDEQNNSTEVAEISDQHKLVDELVASGFDKHSCISRYESSTYRKDKHYQPFPYLISKLRSYEELHARCGPQSLSYRKIIRKLSKSYHIHDNETVQCKYLVWTPANGLGNRMLSMASAFLYSILQNRVLLVEFEADMDGLFCEPFPNSTWLLPNNFPHKNQWSQLSTFKYRENSGESGYLPSFVHLNLQHGHGDNNIQHFICNGTHTFLEKIPVLVLQSDQYFVPSLFMSSYFKEELNRMFPQKDAVFHHLGHYLFNPSNEAWGLITRFYKAYLAKADEKIGLQIRLFHNKKDEPQNVMSQILACTQSQNILPTLGDKKHFPSFHIFRNSTSKTKAILVASLYREYAEELRILYWTRPTMNGDVIGVYQPSHEELQKFGDNVHNMKALAEIYLLSLCDVLLTSPQSTFGYVAQSLGGLKPWIMNSLESKTLMDSPCKRGFSMEPCFHVPPQNDCKGKGKINNITDLYSHLKPCDDVWWGVKLFDKVHSSN